MSRRIIAAALLVIAAMAAGCLAARAGSGGPSSQAPHETARTGQKTAPVAAVVAAPAQIPAATSGATGSSAFADGYRAYRRHDLPAAARQLSYAADHFPPLADYALFYLGLTQEKQGDLPAAVAALKQLVASYPESVMGPKAQLELARIYLRVGLAGDAAAAARAAIALAPNTPVEQASRLELGRALLAQGAARAAYNELMSLRRKYPRGPEDSEARRLVRSILLAHPEAANARSAEYHRDEAALLLRERELAMALDEARAGLSLSPAPELEAELMFLRAAALRPWPAKAEAAFQEYLRFAPAGSSAPEALEALALIYWQRDERALASAAFARLAAQFPKSRLAPGAMLRCGRIFEEDDRFDEARAQYVALLARYPQSGAARQARFRAPWTYYMTERYELAATRFATAQARAGMAGGERDRLAYWRARSLEKSGAREVAREIYARLAASTESNYYPALAARRVAAATPILQAANLPDLRVGPAPAVSGSATFHLERVLALRGLGLKELEPAELQSLAKRTADNPGLGRFVLAGFQEAGDYYDAIVTASRMEKLGELGHADAERVRYPRAYWNLIAPAAAKNRLDPYLVLALVRQESWFNPNATSVSDARGLMQLLPVTARSLAADAGAGAEPSHLYDPAVNIELGTAYLAKLLRLFRGDEARAVAAYNAGERAVEGWNEHFPGQDDEWVENIGYQETRGYVKRVIGGKREYRLLYSAHIASQASRSPE